MGAISLSEPYTPMYPAPKSLRDIAEDNRKAREAGLTYGQWAAIHNQFEPGELKSAPKPPRRPRNNLPFDYATLVQCYNSGMSDKEIAAVMGWSRRGLAGRRTRYGLPPNVRGGGPRVEHGITVEMLAAIDDKIKKAAPKGD